MMWGIVCGQPVINLSLIHHFLLSEEMALEEFSTQGSLWLHLGQRQPRPPKHWVSASSTPSLEKEASPAPAPSQPSVAGTGGGREARQEEVEVADSDLLHIQFTGGGSDPLGPSSSLHLQSVSGGGREQYSENSYMVSMCNRLRNREENTPCPWQVPKSRDTRTCCIVVGHPFHTGDTHLIVVFMF